MGKYKLIYNENTNNLISDIKEYVLKTINTSTKIDTLDLCHLLGKIEYLEKENQLLKEQVKIIKEDVTAVYQEMISLDIIQKVETDDDVELL